MKPVNDSMTNRQAAWKPTIKAMDDGTFEFVGSTPATDRVGDVIEQTGWDVRNYKRNPVVLYAHDYSALPVGRTESITLRDGSLIFRVRFASHARAKEVETMYREGFLSAVSVGFRALETERNKGADGYRIKRAELLELSCVPVPCNAEALIAGKAAGKKMVAVGEKPAVADAAEAVVVEAWIKSIVAPEPAPEPEAAPSWAKALTDRLTKIEAALGLDEDNGDDPAADADADLIDPDEVDDSPDLTDALAAIDSARLTEV